MVDAEQEVRVAAPRPVEERRLVDDVRAGAHRRDRLFGGGPQLRAGVAWQRRGRIVERPTADPSFSISTTRSPRVAQLLEVPLLVLEAALRDELDRRVVADRLRDEAGERGALEREAVVQARKPTRSVAA